MRSLAPHPHQRPEKPLPILLNTGVSKQLSAIAMNTLAFAGANCMGRVISSVNVKEAAKVLI